MQVLKLGSAESDAQSLYACFKKDMKLAHWFKKAAIRYKHIMKFSPSAIFIFPTFVSDYIATA